MSDLDDFLTPGGALGGRLLEWALKRLPDPIAPAPGTHFGPFRIIELVGEGGMGQVYLAERADEAVKQRVALKLVRREFDSPLLRTLFRRERQLLVELDHPNIARFIDAGETAQGQLWLAMAWIEGQTLTSYLAQARCSEQDLFVWMHALCGAVQYAHQRGIVHGDLKPSNVMWHPGDPLKLLDFGIARLQGEQAPSSAHSPAWASPEQRAGKPLGPSADVFQLGRMLQWLLSRCRDVRPGRGLPEIIARATSELPEQRYSSVGELAADLEAAARWEIPKAVRASTWLRFRRLVKRHPIASLASVCVCTLLATMSLSFLWRIEQERDNARQEAQRATAVTNFLTELFEVSDPGFARGNTLTANQILMRGSERLRTELREQPAVRAQLLGTVAGVHTGLGQFTEAEPLAREAVTIAQQSDLPPAQIAQLHRRLAQILWRRGDFAAALPEAEAGLLQLESQDEPMLAVQLLHTKTVCLLMLGQLDAALATQERALAITRAELPPNDRLEALGLNNLARIHAVRGEPLKAVDAMSAARRNLSARLGSDHPDTIDLTISYAKELGSIGRQREALDLLTELTPTAERVIGPDPYRFAYLLIVRAQLRAHFGLLSEAHEDAQQALEHYRARSTSPSLQTSGAEQILGEILLQQGHTSAAQQQLQHAADTRQAQLPPAHPDRITTLAWFARAACANTDFQTGKAVYNQAKAEQQAAQNVLSPTVLEAVAVAAEVCHPIVTAN